MKGSTMEKQDKMVIHCEAELGSSLLDISIHNADAAQLFALSEMLRVNGMAALAQQMSQPTPTPSKLEIVKGSLRPI